MTGAHYMSNLKNRVPGWSYNIDVWHLNNNETIHTGYVAKLCSK